MRSFKVKSVFFYYSIPIFSCQHFLAIYSNTKKDPESIAFGIFVVELFAYSVITDVSGLLGIKEQVADRCNESVDSEGDHREEDVSKSS